MAERLIFLDFETTSLADLAVVGRSRYVSHESTRVLTLVAETPEWLVVWCPMLDEARARRVNELQEEWAHHHKRVSFWWGADVPDELGSEDAWLVAHNAQFDRSVWERFVRLPCLGWRDTMASARAAALPGALAKIGERLGLGSKDEVGQKVMRRMCKDPAMAAACAPGAWVSLLRYNVGDVVLGHHVYDLTWPQFAEAELAEADARINRMGCPIDHALARRLYDLWFKMEHQASSKLLVATDGKLGEHNVRSVKQVQDYLRANGLVLSSLERKQLESFFLDPEGAEGWLAEHDSEHVARVVEVLKLRQQSTRATKGKVVRALESCEGDGRVRDMFVYHGAHPGRWTGRGLQPHNMARGLAHLDVEAILRKWHEDPDGLTLEFLEKPELYRDSKGKQHDVNVDAALSTLFRPIVRAEDGWELAIGDYAQVEGRGVGWVCGEESLLGPFADPERDVYREMAAKIYGIPASEVDTPKRFVGKTTVLGCGYAMSAPKFAAICEVQGIDLAAAGTTPEACVGGYRTACPRVVAGWRALADWAVEEMGGRRMPSRDPLVHEVRHRMATLGVRYERHDDGLHLVFPSGRHMVYRGARLEMETVTPGSHPNLWAATLRALGDEARVRKAFERPRQALKYDHPRFGSASLFGGLQMENLVQGMCRDFQAAAILSLTRMGYWIPLHCHDEIVTSDRRERILRALEDLATTMSTPPEWGRTFPLKVEAYTNRHYTKKPFSTSHTAEGQWGHGVKVREAS